MKRFILTALMMSAAAFATPSMAQWTNISLDIPEPIYDIDFINASTGYAVGWGTERGVLGRTTDAGESWTILPVPNTYLFDVTFADEMNGVITGHDITCTCALVWNTTDGGESWQDKNNYEASFGIYQADFFDADVGYAGGYNGTILKTTNGGRGWFPTGVKSEDVFLNVAAPSADTVYGVAGKDQNFFSPGLLYRTLDGGKNWEILHDFSEEKGFVVTDISFINAREGIISALFDDHFELMKTTDAGEHWRTVYSSNDQSRELRTLEMSADGRGFAAGGASSTAWTVDGGENWHIENLNPPVDLIGVALEKDFVYAVGLGGAALRRSTPFPSSAPESVPGERDHVTVEHLGLAQYRVVSAGSRSGALVLFDILGREVRRFSYEGAALFLDLGGLPSGLYLYRFSGREGSTSGKLQVP